MASEWPHVPVAKLIADGDLVINDGYRAKNKELSTHGLPFARAQNINEGFHFEGADRFPENDLRKVGIKISQAGDVVFTSKGSVGRFALVRPDTPRFVYAPQLCFWRSTNPDRLAPLYLYYWMNSREFFVQFKGVSGQTDMAEYVSLRDQRSMQITIPAPQVQRRIAHALGTLDDKIELNRRMNRTLEKMAAAIFKSWFIDFDPVHAKAEGRDPNLPAEIADLFPDSFEDSELGPIPEGWELKPIVESVHLLSGGTPKTSESTYWDGGIPWFSVKDAPSDSDAWVIETERTVTQQGLDNSAAHVLPERTTIISARGTVGRLALTGVPMAMNQSCYGIRGSKGYSDIYTYYIMRRATGQLQRHTHGTVFDTITRKTFETLHQITSPPCLSVAFDGVVAPLFEKMRANLLQSQVLSRQRDTLLPKLLSGELRVPDAEKIVGRAL